MGITCFICQKKLHLFRHKERCQACHFDICSRCTRTQCIFDRFGVHAFTRVCKKCALERKQRDESVFVSLAEEEDHYIRAREQAELRAVAQQEALRQERHRQKLLDLELRHLGPVSQQPYNRIRSVPQLLDGTNDNTCLPFARNGRELRQNLLKRAELTFAKPVPPNAKKRNVKKCVLCLKEASRGNARYTATCGHRFHWTCLLERQFPEDVKCPTCQAEVAEIVLKKDCNHQRLRDGQKYCRDCGSSAMEINTRLS